MMARIIFCIFTSMKPCKCGSTEFITELNSYDIYNIVNNKLEFIKSEIIDNEIKLYCRNCSEELLI